MAEHLEDRDFLTDPSLVADPYQFHDAMRRCPVRREGHPGVVLAHDHRDLSDAPPLEIDSPAPEHW
jgi:hypothetical protein